jgi:hypothetical protein
MAPALPAPSAVLLVDSTDKPAGALDVAPGCVLSGNPEISLSLDNDVQLTYL